MKKIKLSQDKFAIVSDKDYTSLNKYKWHLLIGRSISYAVRMTLNDKGERRPLSMHRQILGLKWRDGLHADHKDGDGLNNCRSNLRIVTHRQNQFGKRKRKVTSSKFKGVCFHKRLGLWQASINVDFKMKYLGVYEDEKEAAKIYDAAARKHYGRFACLNFVE